MRYEVTMSDGWKIRVNAATAEKAKAKAEAIEYRRGTQAIEVVECEDVQVSDLATRLPF